MIKYHGTFHSNLASHYWLVPVSKRLFGFTETSCSFGIPKLINYLFEIHFKLMLPSSKMEMFSFYSNNI